MGANSVGMAITIGIQVFSLPIFLHYWSIETYGVWLMLTAIPAYLSMADVGMVTAAGNKMTIATGAGDVSEANQIFQSAQLFMFLVCGVIALFVTLIIALLPVIGLATLDKRMAIIALGFTVLIGLLGGLCEALFRATNRFPLGALISNAIRLGEWIGSIIGLWLIGSFSAVAFGGLFARTIFTLIAILYSTKNCHGLKWGVTHASVTEIRTMIKPAIAYMSFSLTNALSFQGITLLVGALLGASAVTLFNTYRTIARVAVQVTGIFSHALTPELSRLFGQGGTNAVEKLWQRSAKLGLIQAVVLSIVLYFISPLLLKVWTHGQVAYIAPLMGLMLFYAAVAGAWHIPRAMLSAVNQPKELAIWSFLTSLILVAMAWLLCNWWQLYGVTLAMLIAEIFLGSVCMYLVKNIVFNRQTI